MTCLFLYFQQSVNYVIKTSDGMRNSNLIFFLLQLLTVLSTANTFLQQRFPMRTKSVAQYHCKSRFLSGLFTGISLCTVASKCHELYQSSTSVSHDLNVIKQISSSTYLSNSGIEIQCEVEKIDSVKAGTSFISDSSSSNSPYSAVQAEVDRIINHLDDHKGVLLTSSYEVPGRYSRWTVGFTAPPVQIEGKGLEFSIEALNSRGDILVDMIRSHLELSPELFSISTASEDGRQVIRGRVVRDSSLQSSFTEEERSKQPSLFSLVRAIRELFLQPRSGGCDSLSGGPGQQQFGLVGAFGYDLAFQFEPVQAAASKQQRAERDLLLFLPDEILVVDGHSRRGEAWKVRYDFASASKSTSTAGLPRDASKAPFRPAAESSSAPFRGRELPQGDYAKTVERAKEQFKVGNLFEVVLSQLFSEPLRPDTKPSHIFNRLLKRNPSPYGFFMNLGRDEYLIGASPEMFVRVEGTASGSLRIETCPISGTIERGSDPLEDALQIRKLLSSLKEESELTMCTDVDRNDKSRICVPGSVKVLGRRQIELYSKLIHTVDHVEGYLREGFDALDAFLCHTWAVTVTGAPKTWAMRFIEQSEPGLRHWYGGAVGIVSFDGSLNTGLTLRTIRVKNGVAEVRAGATLLHESDPMAEEAETELKASALLDAIRRPDLPASTPAAEVIAPIAQGKVVLLVDHEDSFVHTLANYLRQAGATVLTLRSGRPFADFLQSKVDTGVVKPDLVVLSPGPGSPDDFNLKGTISSVLERKLPLFGVCLGLQALVEYYGGRLQVLDTPMHGKPSLISRSQTEEGESAAGWDVLSGLPSQFEVARYHSLYGERATLPAQLRVTASAPDGVIMALQHASLPIAAVQFHPESILTLPKHGMQIINNALTMLTADKFPSVEQ